jgi:Lon protease-like protein
MRELPLFPLNTVLFPGGPLPLRIFETRYIDLVRRCLKQDQGFGVVLLVQGREAAGPVLATAALGTEARIVDFDPLEDGLLGLVCRGVGRIRIHRAWPERDGLNVGEVEDLPPEPTQPVPADCAPLVTVLRRVWGELAGPYRQIEPRFDDAAWVANRLAELSALDVGARQMLLEQDDPVVRLRTLAPLIRVDEEER